MLDGQASQSEVRVEIRPGEPRYPAAYHILASWIYDRRYIFTISITSSAASSADLEFRGM